jgi:molybdopterin molybdotransferase
VVVLCLGDDDLAIGQTSAAQSNALVLAAAAQEAGATVYRSGPGRRDVALLTEAIEDQLVRADLIVAVGGRGNGVYGDLLAALEPLGGLVFAEVDMQPAAPHGFTRIGEGQTPFFVLPGDALAAFTIFEVFVRPMVRVMAADPRPFRQVLRAQTTAGWSSPVNAQEFRYGWLETVDVQARFTASRHTQHLMILAESNAMASVPVGVHDVVEGASVLVIPLDGAV